jgi:membrane associated rhomboid family serine protease
MSTAANDLLEMVLRECEIAGSQPWYPSEYIGATGVNRAALDAAVDQLRMGELICITDWVTGKGQGYVLTPAGAEVLKNPRLLSRLRSGGVNAVPVKETPAAARTARPANWDRASALRDALLTPTRPIVSITLICLNIVNFLIGLALVNQMNGDTGVYLSFGGDAAANQARYLTGALIPSDLEQGHWWRLLTCAFVHIGFIHLAMNMYALYVLGPMMERVWGRFRYLLLYLLTAVAGSATAMWLQPAGMLAGASTSLCGLIGMTLTWFLLNKRHLPQEFATSGLRATITNIFLVVLISFIGNVSWAGHLGGGVAGGLLAVPFNYFSFGKTLDRFLDRVALVLLVCVAGGLLGFVGWQVADSASQIHERRTRASYVTSMQEADAAAQRADHRFDLWARKKNKENVPQDETDLVLQKVNNALELIDKAQQVLSGPLTTDDPRFKKALEHGTNFMQKWHAYLTKEKQFLQRGEVPAEWYAQQQREVRAIDAARQRVQDSVLLKAE